MIKIKSTTNNKLIVYILCFVSYCLIGSGLYGMFGHLFIKATYEGRTLGNLSALLDQPLKYYFDKADSLYFQCLLLIPLTLMLLISGFKYILFIAQKELKKHTDEIDTLPKPQVVFWIALAAGLSLYIELMIIRLHSSYFQLFAYFKNISLLSCFLGLGIGYAIGPKKPVYTILVLPALACQIILLYLFHLTPIARIFHNPITEQLALGYGQATVIRILASYVFIIILFVFNAFCFIPLGHLVSRLMMRQTKLISYGWNLIGSLGGIILFSVLSFMWTQPITWIIIAALLLMIFIRKNVIGLSVAAASTIAMLIILTIPFSPNKYDIYSPYQILTLLLSRNSSPIVQTSNVYYQNILDLRPESIGSSKSLSHSAEYYNLPYYFKAKPENVLVVGSGAGNDVAAAIRNGAGKIDAVEIDPAILMIGKELHPESPYQAGNVRAIIDDARIFIRKTNNKYDLIVYGLLDSHTLLSGKSGGIRLDSYVYTVEGFKEARSKLRADGVISLSFAIMKPELGRKLFLMLKDAFDGKYPLVYENIYDGSYTFLASDKLNKYATYHSSNSKNVTSDFANSRIRVDESTDDWPFFYMPIKRFPISYVVMMVALLIVSIIYIRKYVGFSVSGFSIPCFFLGAGFMLIETKGITELALLYGSTWIVNSIVISCILIMGFLANLLVMRIKRPSILLIYGSLFLALIAGLVVTITGFNNSIPGLTQLIMPIVLTLPLFFSGIAFSSELRKVSSIGVALSSNLIGAMLGGFMEYNSMYFGFRSLYIFALIMYGLAFLGSFQEKKRS